MKIVEESGNRLVIRNNNFINIFIGFCLITVSATFFVGTLPEAHSLNPQLRYDVFFYVGIFLFFVWSFFFQLLGY